MKANQTTAKTTNILNASISSFARHAEGSDFHGSCHNQRSFRGTADSKLVVHEATLNDGFILEHNLVTVAALKPLLILVTMVCTILHLLKVPYHAELPHRSYQVLLLFTTFSNLFIIQQNQVRLQGQQRAKTHKLHNISTDTKLINNTR